MPKLERISPELLRKHVDPLAPIGVDAGGGHDPTVQATIHVNLP